MTAPYLCISPACAGDCSGCNSAISPADMRQYAVRYAHLRRKDPSLDATVDAELFALAKEHDMDCPKCGGAGERPQLVGSGPDAYSEMLSCPDCCGTGNAKNNGGTA